jgi:hypothetical protein
MLKAKFGEMLRSKGDTAHVNELQCKVLCHNICCVIQSMYELGIEAGFGGEGLGEATHGGADRSEHRPPNPHEQ